MKRIKQKARRGFFLLQQGVFQNESVEIDLFDEVVFTEFHVVVLRVVKKVSFYDNGGGDIEFFADFPYVVEKLGIIGYTRPFVDELLYYFAVFKDFCPYSYHNFTRFEVTFREKFFIF